MNLGESSLEELIRRIRKMIMDGHGKQSIANELFHEFEQEDIFLAYHAAMILIKNGLKGQ